MRNILITNDDGVYAPGIVALTKALSLRYRVFVVAPDRERSTIGHALTVRKPIRMWKADPGPYPDNVHLVACDGTPSDCVVLGLSEVCPECDLVVSGINNGANLGDDLTYSGTVSAAMEATISGFPAFAFSLVVGNRKECFFETAAEFALEIVNRWNRDEIPCAPSTLMNVNIPNIEKHMIRGVRATRKGDTGYLGRVSATEDPRGNKLYWITGSFEPKILEGTDVWAIRRCYISMTPVHMDMTNHEFLRDMKDIDFEGISPCEEMPARRG